MPAKYKKTDGTNPTANFVSLHKKTLKHEPLITKDSIPIGNYGEYRKVHITRATRIHGTFHCLTSEGNIASCTDGWLAIDSRGYPYPVNAIEFDLTYKQTETRSNNSDVTDLFS